METNFIKYKPEQFELGELYKSSAGSTIDNNDVREGTLIVGHAGNGKYLYIGYLRGIVRNGEGVVQYEIINAIEGEPDIVFVQYPYKANVLKLPFMAAVFDSGNNVIVGKVIGCNGEQASIYDGSTKLVDVKTIYQLTPYFKETK